MGSELAHEGTLAMQAYVPNDLRPANCRAGRGGYVRAAGNVPSQRPRHVGVLKLDARDVRPAPGERAGDVPDDPARDGDAASLHHPDLGGEVGQLIGLNPRGGLDFNRSPAAIPVRFENVDTNQNVFVLKGCLENRLGWPLRYQLGCTIKRCLDVWDGVDHNAIAYSEPSLVAHVVPEAEAV